MSTRVYSLCSGHGADRVILRWGVSRYGQARDDEMERAVWGDFQPGKATYIEWLPERLHQHSPERMQAKRLRNMRRRIERKYPLFAAQFEAEELARTKYSLEACQADHAARTQIDADHYAAWYAAHPEDRRVHLPNSVLGSSRVTKPD